MIKKIILSVVAAASFLILSACGKSGQETVAPFEVGTDICECVSENASTYSPKFTVNFMIVVGDSEVLYNGKVTLTSTTMLCSEFLNAACESKGYVIEDRDGIVTRIGDYIENAHEKLYWSYDLNGEMALFGYKRLQLRDGDYVKFYFRK